MGDKQDIFAQNRDAMLERILSLVEPRLNSASPAIITDFRSMALSGDDARKEAWALLYAAIHHLKDGAPGHQPGSMAGALSKISLRSSALASAIGVKPPQFEHMLFGADYADGQEAALFLTQRLIEAAEGDISKSRQIISQKILMQRPELTESFARSSRNDIAALKQQMGQSLEMLLESYALACQELKADLNAIRPLPAPPPGQGHHLPRT